MGIRLPKGVIPKPKKPWPQDEWKRRQVALGNCAMCGNPRGDSPYKRFCHRHGELEKIRYRKRTNSRPWKKGMKGGRPIDIPVSTREDVDRIYPAVVRPRKKRRKRNGSDQPESI